MIETQAVVKASNEPPRVCMLPGGSNPIDLLSTSGIEKDACKYKDTYDEIRMLIHCLQSLQGTLEWGSQAIRLPILPERSSAILSSYEVKVLVVR
jgi:hypothetical protein